MKIRFEDIELAYQSVSFGQYGENSAWLDKSSGKIYWHSESGDSDEIPEEVWESHDVIEIPHKRDLGLGRRLVFKFVESTIPDDYDRVREIFSSRGAYARYKVLLDSKGVLQKWYDFENAAEENALRQWCEENNIELLESGGSLGSYEVEQKFPVEDLAGVAERMGALGATVGEPQVEVDLYFAHPARDFAETDEALRIRRKGQKHFITYKGPKIDRTTKTRREIDLPLPAEAGTFDAWRGILEALGFSPVAEVRKSRRKAHIAWQDRNVECSLDEVDRLGTFVELELIADAEQLDTARACIGSLAEELGLSGSERRSYLELLLEQE